MRRKLYMGPPKITSPLAGYQNFRSLASAGSRAQIIARNSPARAGWQKPVSRACTCNRWGSSTISTFHVSYTLYEDNITSQYFHESATAQSFPSDYDLMNIAANILMQKSYQCLPTDTFSMFYNQQTRQFKVKEGSSRARRGWLPSEWCEPGCGGSHSFHHHSWSEALRQLCC